MDNADRASEPRNNFSDETIENCRDAMYSILVASGNHIHIFEYEGVSGLENEEWILIHNNATPLMDSLRTEIAQLKRKVAILESAVSS